MLLYIDMVVYIYIYRFFFSLKMDIWFVYYTFDLLFSNKGNIHIYIEIMMCIRREK